MVCAAGDRLATLSAAPLGAPTAPCLGAVSVPALMCHVSGGGLRDAARALPNCLCGNQAPSFPSSATLSPTPAPKCGFGGESRTNWMEPSAACWSRGQHRCRPRPLSSHAGAMRQPAGQALCHNGQNPAVWLQFGPSPTPRPRTELLAGEPLSASLSQRGSLWCGRSSPVCPPGTSLNFSSPSFFSWDDRSLHGLITRPRPRGPGVPVSPLGGRLLRNCRCPCRWYKLQSGAERGGRVEAPVGRRGVPLPLKGCCWGGKGILGLELT